MKEENLATELRSCVKVEVAVLDSPSLISLMVSVDVKHHVYILWRPCEPGWPSSKALGW